MDNLEILKKWTEFGNNFEAIYHNFPCFTLEDYNKKIEAYEDLQTIVRKYKNSLSIQNQNFVTDLLHIIVITTFLRNNDKWLDMYKNLSKDNQPPQKSNKKICSIRNLTMQSKQSNQST